MAAAAKSATRTLLIERGKGRLKLTIPATAKVTYGLLHPGTRDGGYGREGNVLRIYEGTKQTAMFNGVTEFRDLGYEAEVEKITALSEGKRVEVAGELDQRYDVLTIEREWVAAE
jgi:hypothetical protein